MCNSIKWLSLKSTLQYKANKYSSQSFWLRNLRRFGYFHFMAEKSGVLSVYARIVFQVMSTISESQEKAGTSRGRGLGDAEIDALLLSDARGRILTFLKKQPYASILHVLRRRIIAESSEGSSA